MQQLPCSTQFLGMTPAVTYSRQAGISANMRHTYQEAIARCTNALPGLADERVRGHTTLKGVYSLDDMHA
jgi:hypothetical protein